MSQAAHWLKQKQQGASTGTQRTMKAAKVNSAEYVYPEYLMLCKLVRRVEKDPQLGEMITKRTAPETSSQAAAATEGTDSQHSPLV